MDLDYTISILGFILQGTGVTLKVYVITLVFSIPLGILCALGKLSSFKPLNWFLGAYTWLFRGTPLLLQLFFAYYGLPALGLELDRMSAAYVTFVINYAAYFTEIFRGGIQSIDSGQYEAAKALGMTYAQTMRRIILPQATKVVLPPMGNEAINLIKDTALCAALSVPEILRNAKVTVARDFNVEAYIIAALIYLAFTFIIIRVFRALEKRYSYYSN
ncbi:MAG: amino acid ABC transporter permease [Bacillota bacterium]|jgi:polar amino acid transport system permease protein|nr:amino acid ABC transporter permease [Bacillota bacterium]NLM08857.1 amino acid ABC transporter permease [Clostridiales Family XIII bacterium]